MVRNVILKAVAGVIVFFKKHFGRRKPAEVIRELKFDDGKETLDTSKLVVSHKIFKDKLRPVFITAAAVVLLQWQQWLLLTLSGILTIAGYFIMTENMHTFPMIRIMHFWGSTDGDMTIASAGDSAVIGYDSDGIYMYSSGRKIYRTGFNLFCGSI